MRDHFDPTHDDGPWIYPEQHQQQPHRQHHHHPISVDEPFPAVIPETLTSSSLSSTSTSSSSVEQQTVVMTTTTTSAESAVIGSSPRFLKRPSSLLYNNHDGQEQGGGGGGDAIINSNNLFDCQALQSSLKRVKLSLSPGELRLQRDLITLSPHEWQPLSQQQKQEQQTWIHLPTRARLTVIDSLRLCLYLPAATATSTSSSYHSNYQWKMMIQIPRMFPHKPPVISRIEGAGLSSMVQQIVINEEPPSRSSSLSLQAKATVNVQQPQKYFDESLCYPNTGLNNNSSKNNNNYVNTTANLKTIVWNKWLPIASLADLLDFLLSVAVEKISSTSCVPNRSPAGFWSTAAAAATPPITTFPQQQQQQNLRNKRSYIIHTGARQVTDGSITTTMNENNNVMSMTLNGKYGDDDDHDDDRLSAYFIEEHKLDDNHKNNDDMERGVDYCCYSGTDNNNDGGGIMNDPQSFLHPNRFDVGYVKYNINNKTCSLERRRGATTTSSLSLLFGRHCNQNNHDDMQQDDQQKEEELQGPQQSMMDVN